jgi:GMP synthase (glutamine-hydrolysing)
MPTPSSFVRVLQHVAPEGPGLVERALAARGIGVAVTRPDLGDPVPADLEDAAGLLVMGGPMGVYESDRYPFLNEEERLVQLALAAGVPLLGVCLGSQLLAHVLGARVAKGPRKEIGWFDVTLSEEAVKDPLFADAPRVFRPLHWHGDVFDLPSGAVSLARSELTAHQAFRHGENAHGLLFHLEAESEQVEAMARLFADELAGAHVDAEALLRETKAAVAAAAAVGNAVFGAWAGRVAARARR